MKYKPVMLVIMDGFGYRKETHGNAIAHAKKPNLDYLFSNYPYTFIEASGEAVGLPAGQMGNSEVGHMNIGAGRVVYQSLMRLNNAVRDDTLKDNKAIQDALNHAIQNNSKIHLMGLLSDGGVHSHINHFLYLIDYFKTTPVKEIIVHPFLDGRDVKKDCAEIYFKELVEHLDAKCKIGCVSGRFYAMDRDKNYNRVQPAYEAICYNKGNQKDLFEGLKESYQKEEYDEFVYPYFVDNDTTVEDNDSVIFMNFRPDRAIQMSLALTNPSKTKLENTKEFKNLKYVQMMLYSEDVKGDIAFDKLDLSNIYGEVIADNNLKQLRIAETEKYAHVTYFFDGGVERELKGASRILVNSPKVPTYDMQPEMSAYIVCDKVLNAIDSGEFDTIILNFANCDMVGHTANMEATIKAVEAVDDCVGQIYRKLQEVGGVLVLTADHGNADMVINDDGTPCTTHTTNVVPFLITDKNVKLHETGALSDIAPTMLELLKIKKPSQMTGKSMIKEKGE